MNSHSIDVKNIPLIDIKYRS